MLKNKIIKIIKPLLFKLEYKSRKKANSKNPNKIYKETDVILKFRELEKVLRDYKCPKNDFNKTMSLILTDLEEFIFISKRFIQDRIFLKKITREDEVFRRLEPDAKSYPCHPSETEVDLAIKVDTKSLFIFCILLLNKILLQLKLYLPNSNKKDYSGVKAFYDYLATNNHEEKILSDYKKQFLIDIKWFRCVLSVFRNKFLQHISRGYQTGTIYGWGKDDFALTFYGWEYGDDIKNRAIKFFAKLERSGFSFSDKTKERKNIQFIFDNLEKIPHEDIDEAIYLIEIIGVNSPQPAELISRIEKFIEKNFDFLIKNIDYSELAKYKELKQ